MAEAVPNTHVCLKGQGYDMPFYYDYILSFHHPVQLASSILR